jgi:hypothetical protein
MIEMRQAIMNYLDIIIRLLFLPSFPTLPYGNEMSRDEDFRCNFHGSNRNWSFNFRRMIKKAKKKVSSLVLSGKRNFFCTP